MFSANVIHRDTTAGIKGRERGAMGDNEGHEMNATLLCEDWTQH